MRATVGVLIAAAALATAFAGCLDGRAPASQDLLEALATPLPLATGTGCSVANAIVAYPGTGEYGGYEDEDIRSDFPDGRIHSIGTPVTGPASGSYLSFARCDDGFLFGFTGERVLAPAWDPGGADRHHRVTHLFIPDDKGAATAREWTRWMVDPLATGGIERGDHDTVRASFATGSHMGVYDLVLSAPPTAPMAPLVTRLWFPTEDPETGRMAHRSLDLVDRMPDGPTWHGSSGTGAAVHWFTDNHGPAVAGQYWSGLGQPAWSHAYGGFDREFRLGPEYLEPRPHIA